MPYPPDTFTNYAVSSVAGGAAGRGTPLQAADTTCYVPIGDGAKFPTTATGPFNIVLGTTEIAKCTARAGDVLTLARGQEGTTAGTYADSTSLQLVVSALNLTDAWTAINQGRAFIVQDYGAKGDGVTDDSAAINNAIAAASAAGGGIVLLPPASYAIAATIRPQSGVSVFMYGATLTWTGAASGVMVSNPNTSVLQDMAWRGGTLNAQSSSGTQPMFLQSPQRCHLADLVIRNVSGAGTAALRLEATGTNGPDLVVLKNNAVGNVIEHVTVNGAPIALQLSGPSSSAVCTDNVFNGFKAYNITTTGIRAVQWADSNSFYGTWISLSANSASGVILNDSATPLSNVGVYDFQFFGLDIDAFGITGVNFVTLNNTFQNGIRGYFPGPTASGTFLNDVASGSYSIEFVQQTIPYVQQKLWRSAAVGTAPSLGGLQTGIASQSLPGPPNAQAATDTAGLLQITTTGSPPAAGSVVAIITFANAYTNPPLLMLTNNSAAAANNVAFFGSTSTTSMTIRCNGALAGGTTYNIAWSLLGV